MTISTSNSPIKKGQSSDCCYSSHYCLDKIGGSIYKVKKSLNVKFQFKEDISGDFFCLAGANLKHEITDIKHLYY